jgi:hypothetical protein
MRWTGCFPRGVWLRRFEQSKASRIPFCLNRVLNGSRLSKVRASPLNSGHAEGLRCVFV